MLDKRLISMINKGRCFVLVGSGPSCEVGYPSWENLARLVYQELKQKGKVSDDESYRKYLTNKKYPELFRLAETDLGGNRSNLVDLIKPLLQPSVRKQGFIYELISKWPFACYLTTNFDDEIASYLSKLNEYFTVVRNRQEDFHAFHDGSSHLIQKLHSDLNHPDEVILTSTDYQRFSSDYLGQYFRDKLRQIFEMFNIFIIGHSLYDPDIQIVLQLAKNTANPQHPIFMAAADFTGAEEQEFLEKYNIVLIQYSNRDGTHSELRRILNIADKFIVPRHRLKERDETPPQKEDTEAAIALFLYRRLQGAATTDYMCPILLTGLLLAGGGIPKEKIASIPVLRKINNGQANFQDAIDKAIEQLLQQNLVDDINGTINVTPGGCEIISEYKSVREVEKNQAYGQFQLNLQNNYESLTDSQSEQCRNLAEEAIITSFSNRGLAISNQVYSGQSANPGELSDIFGYVSDIAAEIDDMELRAAFVEAMHQFLIEPNPPQKKYLASVSQGYFLYHSVGLDPSCNQIRRDIFHKTVWICDSSIILPLVAAGCSNNEYAVELFRMLSDAKALIFTTPKLLQEAWEHFTWALELIKNTGGESLKFLRAVSLKGNYKQNLFLDGYIKLSADGRVGTFNDYLDIVMQNKGVSLSAFEEIIVSKNIRLVNISDINGFTQNDWGDIEEAKHNIQSKREERGTFRSAHQVDSEAEVLVIIKKFRERKYSMTDLGCLENVYFVSQSRVIDQVYQQKPATTWTPEALYRYLSALPGSIISSDLLQQCMLHEYYYAGISFIDQDRYKKYFGPSIDAARLSFEEEKAKYINEFDEVYNKNIDDAFLKTPDLEKPFFVAQMGWCVAEKAQKQQELAEKRAFEAEEKAKRLEIEKGRAWKIRDKESQEQEAARLRNLQDTKHLRKRRKQTKKRKKKKK